LQVYAVEGTISRPTFRPFVTIGIENGFQVSCLDIVVVDVKSVDCSALRRGLFEYFQYQIWGMAEHRWTGEIGSAYRAMPVKQKGLVKKNEFERARFYIQSDNCDICDVVAGDGAVSECERKTLSDYGCSYHILPDDVDGLRAHIPHAT